jgi:16S rRNA (cytidine1402-2'-O)-methyltransferase
MTAHKSFVIGANQHAAPPLEPALYLVATPIGNLRDITLRALETIAAADILACEDTRVTRKLLDRYGIKQRTISYHEHNANAQGPKLIAALQTGKSVALVCDAGTPLVSDPGYRLVAEARGQGLRVVPIPGASSVLAALAASAIPAETFVFAGFLAARSNARRSALEKWRTTPATLVFFESPNRLAASLADMEYVFGPQRTASVCRELTKTFEEMKTASLEELAAHYRERDVKGEIVVVIAPPQDKIAFESEEEIDALLARLAAEMKASQAAAEAARLTGRRKDELYKRIVALEKRP